MLRIEKGTRHNPIVLTFRDKPLVFSLEFVQAFGIALGIHLFALILFHISPFKVRNPEITLPPSLVHIELTSGEGQVVTDLHDSEPRLRMPAPPRWTNPSFPDIPDSSSFTDDLTVSMEPLLKKGFDEAPIVLHEEFPVQDAAVHVIVSGPLANYEMDPVIASLTETTPASRQHFAVKVDAKSGTVFWYEQLEGTKEGKIQAEQILGNLRFHAQDRSIILSGEVEIIYD